MQFLIENGCREELIEKLYIKYDESILDIFRLEEDNVVEVMNYLKRIGIKNIEELILFRIEIFTKDIEEIKEAFQKQDIPSLVEEINEDVTNIDKL